MVRAPALVLTGWMDSDAELLAHPRSALDAALAGSGRALRDWRLNRVEASGGGRLMGFDVDLDVDGGGTETALVFLDTGNRPVDTERVRVLQRPEGGPPVRAWVYPQDPYLPALPAATVPEAAAVLLARLGAPLASTPTLEVLSYRPGKRAVVKVVEGGRDRGYLKIVQPELASHIAALHEAFLEARVPVPRVLAWSRDGLLLLEALPGAPAASVIDRVCGSDAFLDELEGLRRLVERVPWAEAARPGAVERRDWYRDALCEALPSRAARVEAVFARLERSLARHPEPAPTTVHRDLHLDQVLVDRDHPDRIVGLIDIDTAGLGDPRSDTGGLLAHLAVLAHWHRDHDRAEAEAAVRLGEAILARERDPRALAPVLAANLLAHALSAALGGADGDERALALIEDAEGALRVDESPLIPVSSAAHLAP